MERQTHKCIACEGVAVGVGPWEVGMLRCSVCSCLLHHECAGRVGAAMARPSEVGRAFGPGMLGASAAARPAPAGRR